MKSFVFFATFLLSTYSYAFDFEGIVKLDNCSGALIRFERQSSKSPAVVMTNGHCHSKGIFGKLLRPTEVLANKKISLDMQIYDAQMKLSKIRAVKILYATMLSTDLALYELNESYESIKKKFDIDPFLLDDVRPQEGMDIDIVSGYWDRGYRCSIDKFIFELHEGGYVFKDSIRFLDGCNTIGGTSGSPLILRGTRTVVGINNTGVDRGKQCSMNNPCEVDEEGKATLNRGRAYGQQTYQIYSCLNAKSEIDLSLEWCQLPRP